MNEQLSIPKYVIAYYLSRYHPRAAFWLGFKSLDDCYEEFAASLGETATGIKNTAQGFDPLFPNGRTGWPNELHKPAFSNTERQMSRLSEFSIRSLCKEYLANANQKPA